MAYTIKDLKKQIENIPDDAIVCIERIEDIYFEKHGWETKRKVFREIEGVPYDYTEYFEAFTTTYLLDTNEVLIIAHY